MFTPINPGRRTMVRIAASAAFIAALVVPAARLQATAPGRNGLIVYQATVGAHVQLFTVRSDGSDNMQLTSLPDSDATGASWSADGSRLVFERDFTDHNEVATMNADGSDMTSLLSGQVFFPSFSPNGKEIVFDRYLPEGEGLWIMNAHGRGLRQITRNEPAGPGECRCEYSPVFSPDGKRIVFVRQINDQTTAVFVVDKNGRNLTQLTPWALGVSVKVDWSPDGTKILVSTPQGERQGTASNVITMRPDGRRLTQLTFDTTPGMRNFADSFSPDGRKIVFARTDTNGLQLHVMNADGTHSRQITNGDDAHWASWGSHR